MIQISMWYVELMKKKKKKVNNVMWCDFLCDVTIDPKLNEIIIKKKQRFY